MADVKKSIQLSRKIPANMKEKIIKLCASNSSYSNGIVKGLIKPTGFNKITSKAKGVSLGADKDGFFVHTHRARSKSYKNPLKITKKWIDWIESTG